MQKNSRHTYGKMNQDLSKSKYTPEVYYEGRNIYIDAEARQSSGSVVNANGTTFILQIPEITYDGFNYNYTVGDNVPQTYQTDLPLSGFMPLSGQYIIGMEPVRDQMIIFTTDFTEEPTAFTPSTIGCVWILDIRPTFSLELVYMNTLDFSTKYPIEAEARYETEDILKVYWTDRVNEIRFLNLSDPDLSNTPIEFVNHVPAWEWGSINMTGVEPGGNFVAGMVGWAYSYSNYNGVETKISPLTKLFNVNYPSDGAAVNDKVGRAFRLAITDVATEFDLINIYRVLYTSLNGEPQITIATRLEANDSTITYVDDYNSVVSTISTADFIINGSDPFISGTIATKNDYLFSGDNKYKYFDADYDARAYRFTNSVDPSEADLYNRNGNLEQTIDGFLLNWPAADAELDAINKSNKANTKLNYKFTHDAKAPYYPDGLGGQDPNYNKYIYQSNGNVVGGDGPNIEYSFLRTTVDVDSSPGAVVKFDPDTSLLNPSQQTLTGFKRDEVYRFGIVMYNNRGQTSFVKWIADVRIPPNVWNDVTNPAMYAYPVATTGPFMQQLQIRFNVSNLPADVIGYQIVRVERTIFESTIIAQGMLNPTMRNFTGEEDDQVGVIRPLPGIDAYHNNLNSLTPGDPGDIHTLSSFVTNPSGGYVRWASGTLEADYQKNMMQFMSHEIDEFTPTVGTYFNVCRLNKPYSTKSTSFSSDNTVFSTPPYPTLGFGEPNNPLQWELWVKGGPDEDTDVNIIRIEPDDRGREYVDPLSTELRELTTIGGSQVEFVTSTFSEVYPAGGPDGGPVFHASDPQKWLAFLVDEDSYKHFVNPGRTEGFVIPNSEAKYLIADYKQDLPNQYGGEDFEARTRNVYIPSSEYTSASKTFTIGWGDTWVTYHIFQQSQLRNRTDFTQTNSSRPVYQFPMECRIRHDLRQTEFIVIDQVATALIENYQYNTVYSQDYDLTPVGAKPLNFQEDAHKIAETAYSDPKLNGEQADSWTVWRTGNRKDADAKWGRIVALVENLDTLFYFQEQAIGMWEVQPYKQTATTDGGILELGTGAVLERRRYLTTNFGTIHKFSIGKSPFGLPFYDEYNRAFRILTNNLEKISDTKGVSTVFRSLPIIGDAPTDANGVSTIWDADREEILMSFIGVSGSTPDFNIAYSFDRQSFVTFYDGITRLFQRGADYTFAVGPTTPGQLFTWGTGPKGQYFLSTYESSITLVMNEVPDMVKLLTNLKWNAECYDGTNHVDDVTISHVEIWNDYQNTGKVDVTTMGFNQFKRLMRNWLLKVPFDEANQMHRMRSQYFFVKLYIDNTTNYEHIIHDIIATYIVQPL